MLPVPEAARPIDVVVLIHVNTVEVTVPVKVIVLTLDPAHTALLLTASTVGIGLTVNRAVFSISGVQLP